MAPNPPVAATNKDAKTQFSSKALHKLLFALFVIGFLAILNKYQYIIADTRIGLYERKTATNHTSQHSRSEFKRITKKIDKVKLLHQMNLTKPPEPEKSDEENKAYLRMVEHYLDFCTTHQLPTYLTRGTLLGLYRYGTILPWDGDVDFCYSHKNLTFFNESFKDPKLHGGYFINSNYMKPSGIVRLCTRSNDTEADLLLSPYWCPTPYIDLYYDTKSCPTPFGNQTQEIESLIYPIREASFMGIKVPAPNKVLPFLKRYFPDKDLLHNCKLRSQKVSCSLFEDYYGIQLNQMPNSSNLPAWPFDRTLRIS